MPVNRAICLAAAVAAMCVCIAPTALADHTLSHLVSPSGSAPYDWNAAVLSPEDVVSTPYMSPDGTRVILATAQPFDPADTDTQVDLYESVGGTFQLLTTGSAGGNGPFPLRHVDFSLDGSRVLFETNEALVPEDRDFMQDVYEHSGAVTQLVSVGDFAGSGVFNAYLRDVSEDGTKAFFSTAETLIADDGDGGYMDVFERSGGNTELNSTGPQTDGDHDATFNDASADGSRVVFTTREPFVSQDTDVNADVYERAGGVTTLISTGPVDAPDEPNDPGAGFNAAARFGGRVIFHTTARLVAEDVDAARDFYARAGGATTLVSTGPTDQGVGSPTFLRASEDASVVLFRTNDRLVPEHTSTSQTGFYRRAGSQTDLIVTYPASNLTNAPFVLSGDGSHVFYTTKSPHVPEDLDGDADIYGWHDAVTELISTGSGDTQTTFARTPFTSFDGERVFFSSFEPLIPGDADGPNEDVFERYGGTTFQISPPGVGPADSIAALSRDGARLLLSSSRPLVPADTDPARRDIYLFTSGAALAFGPAFFATAPPPSPAPPRASQTQASAAVVSPSTGNGKLAMEIQSPLGEFRLATVNPDGTGFGYVTGDAEFRAKAPAWSPDGTTLAFWSGNFQDQGSRAGAIDPDGGNRTWMSESNGFFGVTYPTWSPDGETVAFIWGTKTVPGCAGIGITRVDGTESRIVAPPALPCGKRDLAWSPDGETLVFSGSDGLDPAEIYSLQMNDPMEATRRTNEVNRAENPDWSPDGSKIAYQVDTGNFHPPWDLVRIDADGQNRTGLASGSAPAWSPDRGELAYLDDDTRVSGPVSIDSLFLDAPGGRQIFSTTTSLTDLDWQPVPGGQKGYPRPKGASPVRLSLVPAYRPCAAPNRTHGPPLSSPSCNPPAQGSDHLTVGTADSNGQPTLFSGLLQLETLTGNPSTSADEADMGITASLSDIRCRAAIAPCAGGPLSDYSGQLQARFLVRSTDRLNQLGHAITTQDLTLTAPIACAATPSSPAGSNCTAATTLEAIVPGAVPEGKRSNWQLDQVTIFDGGSDGDPGTGVNTPFARPGIFIP